MSRYRISLPTGNKRLVAFTFTTYEGGDMACLGLEYDGKTLALAFVAVSGIHAIFDVFSQAFARWFVEATSFVERDVEFAIHKAQDGAINDGLAELLYQVQFERWFAWSVGVDKAAIWVKPDQDQSTFDPSVEDAIAIVQRGIEGIGGALRLTSRPIKVGQQEPPHAGPVAFGSASFRCQKLQPDVVAGISGKRLGCQEGITNFTDDELYLLETSRVGFTPVLDHGPQKVDLVFEFATDEGARQGSATFVGVGFELGTAGLDRSGEARRVQGAVRAAVTTHEVDRDTVFAADAHDIAGHGYTIGGDEHLFEHDKGDLLQLFLVAHDPQASLVLADKYARRFDNEFHAFSFPFSRMTRRHHWCLQASTPCVSTMSSRLSFQYPLDGSRRRNRAGAGSTQGAQALSVPFPTGQTAVPPFNS